MILVSIHGAKGLPLLYCPVRQNLRLFQRRFVVAGRLEECKIVTYGMMELAINFVGRLAAGLDLGHQFAVLPPHFVFDDDSPIEESDLDAALEKISRHCSSLFIHVLFFDTLWHPCCIITIILDKLCHLRACCFNSQSSAARNLSRSIMHSLWPLFTMRESDWHSPDCSHRKKFFLTE